MAELASKWPAKRINAILYGTTVLYNLEKNVMYMILLFPFRENVIFYFVRGYSTVLETVYSVFQMVQF